jgi:hypothetical protein
MNGGTVEKKGRKLKEKRNLNKTPLECLKILDNMKYHV